MAEVGATAEDKIPATFSDTAPDVEMFPVHKMICESAGVPPPALSEDPPARLLHEITVNKHIEKNESIKRRKLKERFCRGKTETRLALKMPIACDSRDFPPD